MRTRAKAAFARVSTVTSLIKSDEKLGIIGAYIASYVDSLTTLDNFRVAFGLRCAALRPYALPFLKPKSLCTRRHQVEGEPVVLAVKVSGAENAVVALCGDEDGCEFLLVWSGSSKLVLKIHEREFFEGRGETGFATSRDASLVAACHRPDGEHQGHVFVLTLWRLGEGRVVKTSSFRSDFASVERVDGLLQRECCLSFAPDGAFLAVVPAGLACTAIVRNNGSSKKLRYMCQFLDAPCATFSPQGELAVGGIPSTEHWDIDLWHLDNGPRRVSQFKVTDSNVRLVGLGSGPDCLAYANMRKPPVLQFSDEGRFLIAEHAHVAEGFCIFNVANPQAKPIRVVALPHLDAQPNNWWTTATCAQLDDGQTLRLELHAYEAVDVYHLDLNQRHISHQHVHQETRGNTCGGRDIFAISPSFYVTGYICPDDASTPALVLFDKRLHPAARQHHLLPDFRTIIFEEYGAYCAIA